MVEEINRHQDKEKATQGRSVTLEIRRHGKAGYSSRDDSDGYLEEEGKTQSRQAMKELFDEIKEGSIVGVYSSPRKRAQETAEEMREELVRLSKESNKEVDIRPRRKAFGHPFDISDDLTGEYLKVIRGGEDPIKVWLETQGEQAEEIKDNFGKFLTKFASFTKKFSPKGPNIRIVIVTHTPVPEIFAGLKIPNRTLLRDEDLESLGYCEGYSIEMPMGKEESAHLKLNGKEYELEL